MKKLMITFFLLTCTLLSAKQHPVYVDFSAEKPVWDPTPYTHVIKKAPERAFNGATEVGAYIHYLMDRFSIDTVVETGTYLGNTTAFFALADKEVHTVEIMKKMYEKTKSKLSNYTNITFHLGSSDKVLEALLPTLKSKPLLFYLDAHWYDDWPLLGELEAISKTHYDNCIIVIDDFKVPGRKEIPYDFYGEHECSLEYILPKLVEVFSDYQMHFVIPKNPTVKDPRAKFVAYPKKWLTTHQSS